MTGSVITHWLGTIERGAQLELSAPAVLAGLEWAAPARARIALRARDAQGRWSAWGPASAPAHDGEGPERAHAHFGDPVWTGPAMALQLRVDRRVEGVSVHVVAAQLASTAGSSGDGIEDARRPRVATAATPVSLPAGPGQPPILPRRLWAGSRGPADLPEYGDVRMMFVHHSVNVNGYSPAQVPGMLLSIYVFHRYVRGWNDIGYNFAIDAFGRIWEARAGGIDRAVVGAQAGAYNVESSGVVMLGTFSDVLPSAAALTALERLLAWKLCLHGVPVAGMATVEVDPGDAYYTPFRGGARIRLHTIAGHRDGDSTDCPGGALYAQLPVIRGKVAERVGARQRSLALAGSGAEAVSPAEDLQLAAVQISAGSPVALSGQLREMTTDGRKGAPVADAEITLDAVIGDVEAQLSAPAPAPSPMIATTDADGRFSVSFVPSRNLLVRAVHAETPAVTSALVSIAVAPVLSLALAATRGHEVTVTGVLSPPGARVHIEAASAQGRHRAIDTVTVSPAPDGSFSARLMLRAGRWWLRARTHADSDHVAGQSPRLTVSV